MSNTIKYCATCAVTQQNVFLKGTDKYNQFNAGYLRLKPDSESAKNMKCPFCETVLIDTKLDIEDFSAIEIASNENRQLLEAMIELHNSDIIEYETKMCQFRTSSKETVNQWKQEREQAKIQKQIEDNTPRCPKCGSTAITSGARGVNWTWGIIGASKTVNRCGNCGHTWKPRG